MCIRGFCVARVITFKRYSRAIRASAEDQYGYNILLKYCQQHLYLTATTVVNGQIVEDIPSSEHFYIEVPLEFTIIIELTHEDQLKAAAIREGFTVNIETVANRPGVKVDFPNHTLKLMEPEGSKYAWQNNGVIAVCENDHSIFELQPGSGKTRAAIKAIIVKATKPAFITKPAYMPMWDGALKEYLGLVENVDLVVINKLEQLVKLIDKGIDPAVRAYSISSYTIDAYIEEWAAAPSEYKDPFDIMPILGIGICIFDEAHEVFRKQYLSYIAMSPIVLLDLSATLLPDTAFLKKRYLERFPVDNRFQLEYSAFIDVVGLAYTMKDHKVAQRINKQSMYNHHVFESKVLKRTASANKYFDMLYQVAKKWYLDKYQPGQKMLITLSTRQMCEEVTAYFKARCPEHSVVRYIDGDSYKEACAGDIIISTMGKSGTGVDYVGLILNIIAVSVKASQKSLQMLGRTRDACIERWGIRPVVVYPICMTIPKQVVYYNLKRKLLAGRVNSMVTLNTGICI